MRVLMLSWEYPPVVVGGLGRHVHALARSWRRATRWSCCAGRRPAPTRGRTRAPTASDGVRVIRVAEDPPHLAFERDLVAWTLAMGHAMIREGLRLLRTGGRTWCTRTTGW